MSIADQPHPEQPRTAGPDPLWGETATAWPSEDNQAATVNQCRGGTRTFVERQRYDTTQAPPRATRNHRSPHPPRPRPRGPLSSLWRPGSPYPEPWHRPACHPGLVCALWPVHQVGLAPGARRTHGAPEAGRAQGHATAPAQCGTIELLTGPGRYAGTLRRRCGRRQRESSTLSRKEGAHDTEPAVLPRPHG